MEQNLLAKIDNVTSSDECVSEILDILFKVKIWTTVGWTRFLIWINNGRVWSRSRESRSPTKLKHREKEKKGVRAHNSNNEIFN